jgi:hypothetical protein
MALVCAAEAFGAGAFDCLGFKNIRMPMAQAIPRTAKINSREIFRPAF